LSQREWGGVPDLIEDGINGYLVESGNFQEMAKKIILIFENPSLTYQISANNRKKKFRDMHGKM
jgi:glycosyltransferase involved in cell wall biosynthesis